jgi:hypothetical protein
MCFFLLLRCDNQALAVVLSPAAQPSLSLVHDDVLRPLGMWLAFIEVDLRRAVRPSRMATWRRPYPHARTSSPLPPSPLPLALSDRVTVTRVFQGTSTARRSWASLSTLCSPCPGGKPDPRTKPSAGHPPAPLSRCPCCAAACVLWHALLWRAPLTLLLPCPQPAECGRACSPTWAYPHPLSYTRYKRGARTLRNRLSYFATETFIYSGVSDIVQKVSAPTPPLLAPPGAAAAAPRCLGGPSLRPGLSLLLTALWLCVQFRVERLGLEKAPTLGGAAMTLQNLKVPFTYAWSPSLAPKPR